MKQAIRFEEELHDIRTRIIETILEHIAAANAQDVELNNSIVLNTSFDGDHFTQTMERVKTTGIVVNLEYGYDEDWKFEEFSNQQLIAVLEKMELKEFEVYENSAEQEG